MSADLLARPAHATDVGAAVRRHRLVDGRHPGCHGRPVAGGEPGGDGQHLVTDLRMAGHVRGHRCRGAAVVTLLTDAGVESDAVVAFQRRTGARRWSPSPRWWAATCSSRSCTSTGARKSRSSSSRAVPLRTSHLLRSGTSTISDRRPVSAERTAAARGRRRRGSPPPAGATRVRWDVLSTLEPVDQLPDVEATSVAVLVTSGTTSDPKGVIHDHRTILGELRHMEGWITPGNTNLMGSPVTPRPG